MLKFFFLIFSPVPLKSKMFVYVIILNSHKIKKNINSCKNCQKNAIVFNWKSHEFEKISQNWVNNK